MGLTLVLLLAGLAIAALTFVASGGHALFLPLFFILPFGFFAFGRRGRR